MKLAFILIPMAFAMGCSPDSSGPDSDLTGYLSEPSPEELALELGLPADTQKNLSQRTVKPQDFKNFRINVDIFRKSVSRPILGEFHDIYISALVPDLEGRTEDQVRTEAKSRFTELAAKEFQLVSIDGKPHHAFIISGGLEGYVDGKFKTTTPGNFRLDPIIYTKTLKKSDETSGKANVVYPWVRSKQYHNSQMFWALWIHGGYFIHSTDHYGELGRPASMGCIRQTFPDAISLFKMIVEDRMSAMIRIQRKDSGAATSRLRESIVDPYYIPPADAPVKEVPQDPSKDMNWLLSELRTSLKNINATKAYYGPEIRILGHAWIDPATGEPKPTHWPTCGVFDRAKIDCFSTWGVKKPKNSAN